MKAAVFVGKGKIEIQELDKPTIGTEDVLIEVKASGICGTDIHIYHGEEGSADVAPPVVLGHEFSGEVVEVGSDVKTIQIGHHVTVDPNKYCGICTPCKKGVKQMCEHLYATGVNANGGFAQYCAVSESQCFKINDDIPYEFAALSEPLACCIHGISKIGVHYGDNVCIIGAGAIGLLMVQLARLAGAASVIVSEPIEMRRKAAVECGADYTINPINSDLLEEISKITGQGGADVVIECIGNAKTCAQAVGAATKGGKILLFGVPSPDAKMEVSLSDIYKKELTIKGSFINPDTQEEAVRLINGNKLNLEPIITHRYDLEKIDEAIHKQMDSDSLKVMIIQ